MPRGRKAVVETPPEPEDVAAMRVVLGETGGIAPESVLDELRAQGWELRRIPPELPETPRVFEGFPPDIGGTPEAEHYPKRLRGAALLLERGEIEVVTLSIVFRYYHVADNEDGYVLRIGVIRSLGQGAV